MEKGDDMKMKSKLAAIFALLVLSLAIVGAAYAAWSSTVTINGSATFGTLQLVWTGCSVKDQSSPGANIVASWANDEHTAITLTITNIYPGWWARLYCNTQNTGTLPLKYYSFQITNNVDDRVDEKFHLAFYQPDELTINVQETFRYFETLHTYHDWGIDDQYITFQPGQTHSNLIRILVDSDVNQEWMGYGITATIALTAQVAV
jgi:hypothetical protein